MSEHDFIYVPIGITSLMFMIVAAKKSILLALFVPASLFLLAKMIVGAVKMDLVFNEDGIKIKLFTFNPSYKSIAYDEIESFSFDKLNPMEYGGYGLRYTGRAKGYIVEGRNVLKLKLKNGSNIHLSIKYKDKVSDCLKNIPFE